MLYMETYKMAHQLDLNMEKKNRRLARQVVGNL